MRRRRSGWALLRWTLAELFRRDEPEPQPVEPLMKCEAGWCVPHDHTPRCRHCGTPIPPTEGNT